VFSVAYFPRLAWPSARNVLFSTRNVTGTAPANIPSVSGLFFRDKIIHRTPVYDARAFLNFGRNFTNPGEKQFFLSKIAHAAPQKKQPHSKALSISQFNYDKNKRSERASIGGKASTASAATLAKCHRRKGRETIHPSSFLQKIFPRGSL